MTGLPEHTHRAAAHRQPRRHVTHWGTDGTLHDGAEPSACPECGCEASASCEPGDHTYSWPCVYAPGTGSAS